MSFSFLAQFQSGFGVHVVRRVRELDTTDRRILELSHRESVEKDQRFAAQEQQQMGPSPSTFEIWHWTNCLGSCLTGEDGAGLL